MLYIQFEDLIYGRLLLREWNNEPWWFHIGPENQWVSLRKANRSELVSLSPLINDEEEREIWQLELGRSPKV